MRRWVFVILAVVLVACDSGSSNGTVTTTDAPPDSSVSSSTTLPPGETRTPLTTRMNWLAEVFTRGELDESEYQSTFTSDFLDAVSYDEFAVVIRQLGGGEGTWEVSTYESREDLSAVAIISSTGDDSIRANMTIEAVAPYRISGLFIQPTEPPTLEEPPADLEEAAARLSELGELELGVMEVVDGECVAVFAEGGDDPMPVGSAIKLYVLGAVADAVASGDVSWDQEVAITEEHRSIPTGVLQDEEVGATFSVREVAETMIAFSDNTATDHLIGLVGREAVEQALSDYGMEQPELNIPFMDTMELSALKIGPAAGLATQWVEADEEGRRQILDQISDIRPEDLPLAEFTTPVQPDVIEWFASPSDVCRVLQALVELGEPVTQILSINPGFEDEDGNFDYIAFKGGAEPGVVSSNWLVERTDGRVFVVSGSVLEPEEGLDQLEATLLFGAVRDLVSGLD